MKSKLFSLIKSKSFIGGFIAGVFITTVAAIVLFSFNSPPPNTKHLKGTMSGSNIEIGTTGEILGVLPSVTPCPSYSGSDYAVLFDGDGPGDAFICLGEQGLTENQRICVSQIIDCGIVVSASQ
ncbi:MAG: hypothetical protein ACOYN4_12210 [Bacteroidales bacterium]